MKNKTYLKTLLSLPTDKEDKKNKEEWIDSLWKDSNNLSEEDFKRRLHESYDLLQVKKLNQIIDKLSSINQKFGFFVIITVAALLISLVMVMMPHSR